MSSKLNRIGAAPAARSAGQDWTRRRSRSIRRPEPRAGRSSPQLRPSRAGHHLQQRMETPEAGSLELPQLVRCALSIVTNDAPACVANRAPGDRGVDDDRRTRFGTRRAVEITRISVRELVGACVRAGVWWMVLDGFGLTRRDSVALLTSCGVVARRRQGPLA